MLLLLFYRKQSQKPEFYNQVGVDHPELQKEKWDIDTTQIKLMADEALGEYTKTLKQLESEV